MTGRYSDEQMMKNLHYFWKLKSNYQSRQLALDSLSIMRLSPLWNLAHLIAWLFGQSDVTVAV